MIHRTGTLVAGEITSKDNIAITAPARTLADLHRVASRAEYRRALRQAEFLRLPIGEPTDADGTRSGLERSFVAFCRRHHLPQPKVNVKVGPYTADFLWPAQKVIVETDSFRTHGGPVAFEEDRARDVWFKVRGFMVLRVTDRQLEHDPAGIASSLRSVLEH